MPQNRLKLNDALVFRFADGNLIIENLSRKSLSTFPSRIATLVALFATWTPVSDAFELGINMPYEDILIAIRQLVNDQVLIVEDETDLESSTFDRAWKNWNAASTFHLATRTSSETEFECVEATANRLREKTVAEPYPPVHKEYEELPLQLFENVDLTTTSEFRDTLLARRTCRRFSDRQITVDELSQLLYYTWGATMASTKRFGKDPFIKRTSPAGGSLHSVEVYPVILNVDGMEPGTYHYSVKEHGVARISDQDPAEWICSACGDQNWIAESAVVFAMTSVIYRVAWKYESSRAYRVLLFDIGHLSQTFLLTATWLGLGCYVSAALRDEAIERALGVDGVNEPVFLVTGAGHVA